MRIFSVLARCVAAVLLVGGVSCTRKAPEAPVAQDFSKKSAAEMVEYFVRLSADSKSVADKDRLQSLCQGKLKQAFQKMSPENFQAAYLGGGLEVKEFVLKDHKTKDGDALVHYQVKIKNKQGSLPTEESNEREVSLVQVNGQWYLDSIRPKGKDQVAFTGGMIF